VLQIDLSLNLTPLSVRFLAPLVTVLAIVQLETNLQLLILDFSDSSTVEEFFSVQLSDSFWSQIALAIPVWLILVVSPTVKRYK
ncbi:MAG: hypothetical protein EZS28_038605, partial [Streblomastix strix]